MTNKPINNPINKPILICTDLDRTLLPNGHQPESPQARACFSDLVSRPEISLAYVSGRDKPLVLQAIADYSIPIPDYLIGDVGTSIYQWTDQRWRHWDDWHEHIAPDWAGRSRRDIERLLGDISLLSLQEDSKQNRFKLSYYAPHDTNQETLLSTIRDRLESQEIRANLIWSVDETADIGLLDILPQSATKFHAIEYLIKRQGFAVSDTVFAGDSGNDIPVLCSEIPSVLVANATPIVAEQALALARQHNTQTTLYLAQGQFLGMNGNYSAGILEGVAHYFPHTKPWMACVKNNNVNQ